MLPKVSVILPVYNNPRGIELTLESVTGQTYPTDRYEVLVADNGSTDNGATRAVVQRYSDRYNQVTLMIETEIQSPAAARNKAIDHASGSIYACIDADMTVKETWLTSVVEILTEGEHDYMGCDIETYPPGSETTISTEYDRLFAFPIEEYITESHFAGAGCLAVRRDVIDAVGAFDTDLVFGADKEFGHRVHEAGFDLHFEPSITMYHPSRESIADHISKSLRIGRGKRHLHEAYPELFGESSPFAARNFVPLNPFWFRSQLEEKDVQSTCDMMGLWVVGSANKISRNIGSLYEWAIDTPSSRG